MDKEILIYIVFVAIAIISRVLKSSKKDKSKAPKRTAERPASQNVEKTKTFEELLREFTGETTSSQPSPSKTFEAEFDDFDFEEEERVEETYRKSVNEAKNLKTLDEQVDLEDIPTKSQYFKEYDQKEENSVANDILQSLKDPNGARKAVILSEILNRKY
ncbi:hypothetical protein LVD15_25630 [Fulvivirga maritima]|uniref:hypothetical protein n=1 Tax=Fulvivirga maritima TaxID=2904247 RepID=UPI001F3961E0|nr:hypothetical protein [Fulvivirga maritima]UII26635.1 hypothetical protein LVD15_25630 [Fulvivirga maritima]